MGTRICYEIAYAKDGGAEPPLATLFSNSSHPDVDPELTFMKAAREAVGPRALVMALLDMRYPHAGGNHVAGDPLFNFVSYPHADCERVVGATFTDAGFRVVSTSDKPVVLHLTGDKARTFVEVMDVVKRNSDDPYIGKAERMLINEIDVELDMAGLREDNTPSPR